MEFMYPVPSNSIVTQNFTDHVRAARINHWENYNGGIDFAVGMGTVVVAAQDGTVSQVRRDATGYGTHVRIQHGEGYSTIYGHMMDFSVKAGQQVKMGQAIGLSGSTGNSTGPHVHFELRKNNIAVDPQKLLTYPNPVSPLVLPEELLGWKPKVGEEVAIPQGWNLRSEPYEEPWTDVGTTDNDLIARVEEVDVKNGYTLVTAKLYVATKALKGIV